MIWDNGINDLQMGLNQLNLTFNVVSFFIESQKEAN